MDNILKEQVESLNSTVSAKLMLQEAEITRLTERLQEMETTYDKQQATIGVAGGGHYTHKGAAVNALCLPTQPVYDVNVMIPATNVCHSDWTLEYTGYLMAGYYNHASSTEYICMDRAMEGDHGSKPNQNGKVFYYVLVYTMNQRRSTFIHSQALSYSRVACLPEKRNSSMSTRIAKHSPLIGQNIITCA
nr:hypothetical protein BaRGS_023373 [Batillaria attramentaria]